MQRFLLVKQKGRLKISFVVTGDFVLFTVVYKEWLQFLMVQLVPYTFLERKAETNFSSKTSRTSAFSHNLKVFGNAIGLSLSTSPFGCEKQDGQDTPDFGNREFAFCDDDEIDADVLETVEEFVEVVHGNAHWYNEKVASEVRWQRIYLYFSIFLLVSLPILIAWGAPLLGQLELFPDNNQNVVTAQVLAFLTSIIGLQRSFSAWFGRRRVLGRRWRARSALIDIIFELQVKHKSTFNPPSERRKDSKLSIRGAFIEDLREGIQKAREIVSEETQEFFDTYALPEIDVGKSIINAQGNASKIYQAFRAPMDSVLKANRDRKEELIRLSRDHRQVETKIDFLQGEFDRVDQKISRMGGRESENLNAQEREVFFRLVNEIEDLETQIERARQTKLRIELERQVMSGQ